MGQVSITSQEQITLPVSIRRRWGIAGAASLDLEFDEENNLVVLRPKPSVDEVLKYLSSLPRNRKAAHWSMCTSSTSENASLFTFDQKLARQCPAGVLVP